MSDENQELMAQISQLAGQINRHKLQTSNSPHQISPYPTYPRGTYSGYPRGRHVTRGNYRVARPVHRNRTLVLNQPATPTRADTSSEGNSDVSASFVSSRGRHMQLVNSDIFAQTTQARAKAIEKTAAERRRQRYQREQRQVLDHFRQAQPRQTVALSTPLTNSAHEIVVEGITFRVIKNGSKLVKLPDDRNHPSATPKTTIIAGVQFFRTKNGNMYRHGIVKAQQKAAVRKTDVPCKHFSTTGSCQKGPLCRYVHDPAKVAICRDYLQQGSCDIGDSCDLSHDLTPQRTPTCLHYAKGKCSYPDCRYAHADLPPNAPFCRDFGLYGYCKKGTDCPMRHSFECPDFSNDGVCKNKGCKLLHRERASVLRKKQKQTQSQATRVRGGAMHDDVDNNDGDGDLSSDDGMSTDSDDVDSDEVEEFIGQEDYSTDFADQKDFIQF